MNLILHLEIKGNKKEIKKDVQHILQGPVVTGLGAVNQQLKDEGRDIALELIKSEIQMRRHSRESEEQAMRHTPKGYRIEPARCTSRNHESTEMER